jgi:hypothetical protein
MNSWEALAQFIYGMENYQIEAQNVIFVFSASTRNN